MEQRSLRLLENPVDRLARTVEALLVIAPAALSVQELATAAEDEPERVETALGLLSSRYREGRSGIVLEQVAGGYAFRAAREAAEACARLVERPVQRGLSQPALETLAIVAYLGPVSRPEIARIRGVAADSAVAGLVERGLIAEAGRDKEGGQKGNFEPGSDVMAKATVLAEGCWGHLTGAAQKGLGMAGNDPQVWALGVKEVWEVEKPLDKVIHTLGWPLRPQAKYQEFGGSWIYGMNREGEKPKVSIGFVCGLDNADARISVHDLLQEFKLHPLVKKVLEGGKRVAWGAKAIPEGGYWALPRLSHPGMVVCGDAGGMVNVPKLKGIHYAIESGRLAAETIYEQLKAGSTDFSAYEKAVHEGDIGKDLYESRNMKQPFAKGLVVGGAIVNAMTVTKGHFPGGHWPTHRDAEAGLLMTDRHKRYPKPDGKYTFDKLSGVFLTGNATRDDAPSHIRIEKKVPREVAEAWQWMCPAGVYEVPEDAPESGPIDLIVNPSNCVQCGAITAKGGRLTPPEGGDGPLYQIT